MVPVVTNMLNDFVKSQISRFAHTVHTTVQFLYLPHVSAISWSSLGSIKHLAI